MKTKNGLILILTVLVVYFAYRNYQLSSPDNDSENSEDISFLSTDAQLQSSLTDEIDNFSGEFISKDTAKDKLKRFNDWNLGNGNAGPKFTPFAFAFGISMIDSLMTNINTYNDQIRTPDKRIVAIRMYLVKSIKKPGNGRNPFLNNDLLLVPVDEDGNDFIQLDTTYNLVDSSGYILNTSQPCPNNCDQ